MTVDRQKLFEAVYEYSPCAFLIADDEGRYVDVNPAGEKLLGMPREKLIGKYIRDFAAPIHTDRANELWTDFQRDGQQAGNFVISRPDGTDRIVAYLAVTDFMPGLHLSVAYDITDLRRPRL